MSRLSTERWPTRAQAEHAGQIPRDEKQKPGQGAVGLPLDDLARGGLGIDPVHAQGQADGVLLATWGRTTFSRQSRMAMNMMVSAQAQLDERWWAGPAHERAQMEQAER
jgi:hypothetical protein